MEDSLAACRGTPALSKEEMSLPCSAQSRACGSVSISIKYPQNYITKFIMSGVNSTDRW